MKIKKYYFLNSFEFNHGEYVGKFTFSNNFSN